VVAGYNIGAGNRREREWLHPIWMWLFLYSANLKEIIGILKRVIECPRRT
jgi:hypothetical protein